jgi:hypothetical protein
VVGGGLLPGIAAIEAAGGAVAFARLVSSPAGAAVVVFIGVVAAAAPSAPHEVGGARAAVGGVTELMATVALAEDWSGVELDGAATFPEEERSRLQDFRGECVSGVKDSKDDGFVWVTLLFEEPTRWFDEAYALEVGVAG